MPQGVIASCLTLERLFKLAEAHFYYFLMKMSDNLCLRDVTRIKRETSMVVQWLRLYTPNAGTPVRSLVRELDHPCCN